MFIFNKKGIEKALKEFNLLEPTLRFLGIVAI
jgi:hypothetical protein